jgi:hypothetical protein
VLKKRHDNAMFLYDTLLLNSGCCARVG